MFTRFNGNVEPFASDATGTERTVFGDTAQSDNINDNLNADFLRGWGIVGVNDNPTKQDFNALAYTISNLVAYLYQQGIAEWNTTQKYLANSYVVGSDGKIYRAKTGTIDTPNEGNDPTIDSTNWENLDSKFVDLLNSQTIAGIKTFSSFPITPSSAPTTDYQVANKKYVDDKQTGKILQVVSFTKSDFTTLNSSSFLDTGIEATITPTSTTSKILVLMSVTFGVDTNDCYTQWVLDRNGTSVGIGDPIGSATRATFGWHTPYNGGVPSNYTYNANSQYLDTPSSTSALTYKIKARARLSPAVNLFINRSSNTVDGNRTAGISTITLIEVGA